MLSIWTSSIGDYHLHRDYHVIFQIQGPCPNPSRDRPKALPPLTRTSRNASDAKHRSCWEDGCQHPLCERVVQCEYGRLGLFDCVGIEGVGWGDDAGELRKEGSSGYGCDWPRS